MPLEWNHSYPSIWGCLQLPKEFATTQLLGFPGGSNGRESSCNAGDVSSIPGLGIFPGEGNGNPLQYSSLKNPVARGAWWATVHGVSKSQTRLSD